LAKDIVELEKDAELLQVDAEVVLLNYRPMDLILLYVVTITSSSNWPGYCLSIELTIR